uniref:Uncharacterized protein n=1 Tax=Trichogramma kaykai TaxID=54128 RepID=A0ABD2VTJ3_9HYME
MGVRPNIWRFLNTMKKVMLGYTIDYAKSTCIMPEEMAMNGSQNYLLTLKKQTSCQKQIGSFCLILCKLAVSPTLSKQLQQEEQQLPQEEQQQLQQEEQQQLQQEEQQQLQQEEQQLPQEEQQQQLEQEE